MHNVKGIRRLIQDRIDNGEVLTSVKAMRLFFTYTAVTRLRETTHSSLVHPDGYKIYFKRYDLNEPWQNGISRNRVMYSGPFQITKFFNEYSLSCGDVHIKNFSSIADAKNYISYNITKDER